MCGEEVPAGNSGTRELLPLSTGTPFVLCDSASSAGELTPGPSMSFCRRKRLTHTHSLLSEAITPVQQHSSEI